MSNNPSKKERRSIKNKDSTNRKMPRHPPEFRKPKTIYRWYKRLRTEKMRVANERREELLLTYTKAERAFEKILQEIGIDYDREYIVLLRDFSARFIDFYSKTAKIGFEVDGGYHKERVEYDIDRDIGIMSMNILMARFTNDDVLSDPDCTKDRIVQTLWSRVDWWAKKGYWKRMNDWTSKSIRESADKAIKQIATSA